MSALVWVAWSAAAILAAGGLYVAGRALLADRARGRRRCPSCWYDLAGVAGLRCPECGREARSERALLRTRRHKRRAVGGLAMVVLAGAVAMLPRVVRDPWSLVPTPALAVMLSFYDDEAGRLYARLAGAVARGQTTRWERLLLARHCATLLCDPALITRPRAELGAALTDVPQPIQTLLYQQTRLQQVLVTVQQLGPEARPAIGAVAALAEDTDPLIRGAAVRTLVMLWPGTAELRAAVERALFHEDRHTRFTAARGLGAAAPRALDAIPMLERSALASERGTGRIAVEALGRHGAPAVPSLLRCLREGSRDARFIAAGWLGAIGPDAGPDAGTVAPALADTLADPWWMSRESAARALHNLGPGAAPALPALRRAALNDEHVGVRVAGVIAAAAVGGHAVTGLLAEALGDPDPRVRWAAAVELERLGPLAREAVPALREASRDAETGVAAAARRALAAVAGEP